MRYGTTASTASSPSGVEVEPKEVEAMALIVAAAGGNLLVRKFANLTPTQVITYVLCPSLFFSLFFLPFLPFFILLPVRL